MNERRPGWWSIVAIALAVTGCGDDPPAVEPTVSPVDEPASVPNDCATLAVAARTDDDDAAVLVTLCPDVALERLSARGALRAASTSADAARLLPRLTAFPDLRGLAELGALPTPSPSIPSTVPDPDTLGVTPVDDAVLAAVRDALAVITVEEPTSERAERARALLARVHAEAVRQLGIDERRGPSPFGRLLAGLALHYGQAFLDAYARRPAPGLADARRRTERDVEALGRALGLGTPAIDAPFVAIAIHRIDARTWSAELELERLLAHRLHGLAQAHVDTLDATHPRVFFEDMAVHHEVESIDWILPSGGGERPLEDEQSESPPRDEPWPTRAEKLADAIIEQWSALPSEGFARRVAIARIELGLQRRPDVVGILLARLTREPEPSSELLRSVLRWAPRADDGGAAWLRRRAAADAIAPPADRDADEAARRRRFADRVRPPG